jgi:large repetitive protein
MRTVPRRSSIALLTAVVAALAALAGPAVAAADEGQIIVKYATGADAQERSEARADADVVRDQALALPRTELVTPEAGTTVGEAVADLERSDDVDYAEPDLPRRAFDLYPDEARFDGNGNLVRNAPFTNLWALHNTGQLLSGHPGTGGTSDADIDAPAAWDVTTGSPDVTVAVVDSGVDRSHPDLFANLVPGWDYAYDDADPTDYDGHGTHVAGIIGARGNNGVGITGVAWQTRLMPVQALDAEGSGTTSDIVDAYKFAKTNGAKIVNASFGGSGFSQYEYNAIRDAPNVLFVAAAGNAAPGSAATNDDVTPEYPCGYNLPNVICVAATDNNDRLADFSNYGPTKVDIAAPGNNIYSTYKCDSYAYMSGTSMAAPEVSGAAALVLSKDPTLTPAAVRGLLTETADPLSVEDAGKIGGGRLNVANAVGAGAVNGDQTSTASAAGTGNGTQVTFATPRTNEPQPPAPACPAAPSATSTGSGTTAPANPSVPATPSTPVAAPRATTPAADRTAPAIATALSGRGALRALIAGRLRVSTTVSERSSVRLELRLDARTAKKLRLTKRAAAVKIATGSATASRAGTKTVTLRLTGKAKRALPRVRSVKATLVATAADTAGNRRTRSTTLTISR